MSEQDCIFCKIASGEIPADIVYQDEDVVVFPDINPATPVHLLVVTRRHIERLSDFGEEDTLLAGRILAAANKVARAKGLAENGYRVVINSGPDAGQVVWHVHAHILGGREMDWKH